jgi:hypothetical protein
MSTRPTLAALLRGRSRAAVARFVAALHAARGAETRVEGNVAMIDGDRVLVAPRRLALVGLEVGRLRAPWRSPPAVDRVVTVDAARAGLLSRRYDAPVLTPADLDRLARYGLDRAAADAVYREQFGRPVAAVDPAPGASPPATSSAAQSRRRERAPGRPRPGTFVGALLVLAALALLGAAVAGAGAGPTAAPLPWPWDAADALSVSSPLTTTPASDGARSEPTSAREAETRDARSPPPSGATPTAVDRPDTALAPGLSVDGVTDVGALATAHAAALGNGSYRWELTYVESVNGTVAARGTETVRVDSRRRFRSTVDWTGDPLAFTPLATRGSYADGTARYRPATDGTGAVTRSLVDVHPAGEQGWRATRYLRWYLSARSSTVERTITRWDRSIAVVVLNGTDYPGADRYAARAYVTDDGFVQSLSVSYVLTDPDGSLVERDGSAPVHVRFAFHYYPGAGVSVSPPPWYTPRSAGNTTDGNTTDGTTEPD